MLLKLFLVISVAFAFSEARGVFYVFTEDGINVIDPSQLRVLKTIPHNTSLPGGEGRLCTPSTYQKKRCSWAGMVNVGGKYIYVADSAGNRLIVIDTKLQKPIKAIKTNGFPYQVKYIAALDEIWVMCWRNNILNVIGGQNGVTAIHKIRNASSMKVVHSIQAQNVKVYKYLIHGFFEAENSQNIDPNVKYGVATHFSESGIHKIDLRNKAHDKFINTSSSACYSTLGLAYSSIKKYAFVQCLGKLVGQRRRKILVIDVENEHVVHDDDAIMNGATGYPYASPDGKYVVVLNPKKIITYYLSTKTDKMTRLRDIELPNFWPSKIAFVQTKNGYLAYVTSKNTDTILSIQLQGLRAPKTWLISGVGNAVGNSVKQLNKRMLQSYKKAYLRILQKSGIPFNKMMFWQYIKKMKMQHVVRRITIGGGKEHSYVLSPAVGDTHIVVIDGKTRTLIGRIGGIEKARSAIWVNE